MKNALVAILTLVLFVFSFSAMAHDPSASHSLIRISGDSMNPTFVDGDIAIIELDQSVTRDSIVLYMRPDNYGSYSIARCVAVPGDGVCRKNGVTHVLYSTLDVSGSSSVVDIPLDERYASYFPYGSDTDYDVYILKSDEYFLVGDNRYNCIDSRNWLDNDSSDDIGPVTSDMILGVACGKADFFESQYE